MIINPQQVTNFERTDEQLEVFWLFCLMVAGKNARVIASAVERLLAPAFYYFDPTGGMYVEDTRVPVWYVRPGHWLRMLDKAGVLRAALKHARTGKYTLLEQAIRESFKLNLRTASVDQLMNIHGVGPKTARYFMMHTRPDQRVAALDTHILAWLRDQGYDAPPVTPSNPKKYAELEAAFLKECDARGKTPAEFDLEIWNSRSKNGTGAAAA